MISPPKIALTRSRYIAVTIGAAMIAGLTAVLLVGAPPIPALAGVALAVAWLFRRAPRA
jgi:hypothetical protein